jgi:hypothetical protein
LERKARDIGQGQTAAESGSRVRSSDIIVSAVEGKNERREITGSDLPCLKDPSRCCVEN